MAAALRSTFTLQTGFVFQLDANDRHRPLSAFTVAVCTRDRPAQLARTLEALEPQSDGVFTILVIDQSDVADPALERRARDRLRVLRDDGRGLSRARNLAARIAHTEWVAFIDDDCRVDPGWAEEVARAIAAHPEVDYITGHIDEGDVAPGDHVGAAARPVARECVMTGRWTRPEELGYGVMMIVRRSAIEALGGWDERLGAGNADFPAAEDVDFNYRLLRDGRAALATPRIRATHEQWRNADQTVGLYRGYARAYGAFSLKHMRTGDIGGGVWLWLRATREIVRLVASSARHRSPLRLRVAIAQARGLAEGTVMALRRVW